MKKITNNITLVSILAIMVSLQGLVPIPTYAASCKQNATVEFIFRNGNNSLADDITWELIKQERNFDGGKYLGRSVRRGKIENDGSVVFTLNPLSIVSESNRGGSTAFAVKVYDVNREAGATIFWDVIISCGSHIKKTFKLSTLSVVVRNTQGTPLIRHPFHIFTQTRGFNNKPIIDEPISTRLHTELGGVKKIYLAPGEYIVKIPVPGNSRQTYEVTSVLIHPERDEVLDYRAGNVQITINDGKGLAIENAAIELFTQEMDGFGNPILGTKRGSVRTGFNGHATLFHPAGIYALKVTGPQRSTYTFFNVVIFQESNTVIEKQISTINVQTRDENGTLKRGVRVSVAEQFINSDGEQVEGRVVQKVASNQVGVATFYVAPGTYTIIAGHDRVNNIIVTEGKTTSATYRKSSRAVAGRGAQASPQVVVKGIMFDALPSGSLVKTASNPAVYFIEKGTLRAIPDEATFRALNFKWDAIHTISQSAFSEYPVVSPLPQIQGIVLSEGTLAKSNQSPAVYLITGGNKRAFHDGYTFELLGYSFSSVVNVSTFVLDQYPTGETIKVPVSANATLIKSGDNSVVYKLENGFKRPYESEESFFADGHDWGEVLTVPFAKIRSYPLGALIR
jgi:hypothetical protein